MRKALIIFTCVLGVMAVGAMLARCAAGSTTAPDVRVTFLGLTNGSGGWQDARFQVLNRGGGGILVLEVGIEAGEPFGSLSLPGTVLGKPVIVQPGVPREFRTPFVTVTSRWRGNVTVSSDTPLQRYRDWLLRQPWRSYLPRKWLPNRNGVYTFHGPWQEKSLNRPHAANPAISFPLSARGERRGLADWERSQPLEKSDASCK